MNSTHGASVTAENLVFSYATHAPVLNGLSLRVRPGERLGVLGQSGAGKSTFLLHLNGLLLPQSGSLHIGDVPVTAANLPVIRSEVGIVFQNPDDQLFNTTVGEDVAFGPENLQWPADVVKSNVNRALADMSLEGYEDRSVHELSYGEKRRVALATVLSMRPRVIGFDEPFANLDPGMVEQLVGVIQRLDATVILVSQAVLPALACCDRIAVFRAGRVEAVGSTEEIAKDGPLLRACGIDFHFYGRIWRQFFGSANVR